MGFIQTRIGRLLHTQSEYKVRTKECDAFEDRLRFIADKIMFIKSNIDIYKYLVDPKHALLVDYASQFFCLVVDNCYKTIVVELRALLDREENKVKQSVKESKNVKRGKTLFGLMDYALENEDKLFEKERIKEYEWSDGEITKDVEKLEPIKDLIEDISQKIDEKKELLELLRMTRNKLVAHFDLDVPGRAIYFDEMDEIVNELAQWLDSFSVRYNGVAHGYLTDVGLSGLLCVVESYDKYKDLIHEKDRAEMLEKLKLK